MCKKLFILKLLISRLSRTVNEYDICVCLKLPPKKCKKNNYILVNKLQQLILYYPHPTDLLNEDLSTLSRQITDIDLEKEITIVTEDDKGEQLMGDGSSLPPFPDLRVLNLAYNKVLS